MIRIHLNDKLQELKTEQSLQDLLSQNDFTDLHFAVAINNQFIPRTAYSSTLLAEGDRVDIITPMQGG